MNFSENMAELDKILKNLESDSVPLEESLREFERGVALVRECRSYLLDVRQKVTILTENGERIFDDGKEG